MCVCTFVCVYVYVHTGVYILVCVCTYVCMYIHVCAYMYVPYLSILKPGSNIRWVAKQNERIKRLGLFKRRVPKMLNSINLKMLLRKISLFSVSLLIFVSPFRMLLESIVHSLLLIMFVVFPPGMHLRVLLHQSVREVHILL